MTSQNYVCGAFPDLNCSFFEVFVCWFPFLVYSSGRKMHAQLGLDRVTDSRKLIPLIKSFVVSALYFGSFSC